MTHGSLDKSRTDSLINFIKNKISKNELGSFSHEGTKIEIHTKKSAKTKRTSVITLHHAEHITFEPIRKKVFMDFYDKLTQFEAYAPIFWVIDCGRWKYDLYDFKRIIYSTITSDATIAKFLPGLSNLIPTVANIELFNGTDLIPTLTYPLKDGLFFLKESACLNGIITKTHGKYNSFINPFAKHQLDINSIRQLKELLTNG